MRTGAHSQYRTVLSERLAAEYATTLAAIPDTRWRARGIAAGNAAAEAMLVARQGDGRFAPSPWVPSSAPGHWQPLLNSDGTQQLDPTPWIGAVRPFLIESSSQFRTDGPPALRSAAWAQDFNEVKAIGSLNSTVRTPEQTHIALFWQSNVAPTWNAVARDQSGRHMDGAPHCTVSRAPVGAPVSRRRTPPSAADLLRHGQDPVQRAKRPFPG